MTIPALVITYARLDGLQSVVNSCLEAGVTKIYVAIDGPRDEDTAESQSKMHSYLTSLASSEDLSVTVWQRTENLGIAVSVITAIDWFFKYEVEGVILEDDLKFDQSFIDYSSAALSFFAMDKDIQIISGNRYDEDSTKLPVLVNYPQTWGWGTWRSKWAEIRAGITKHPELRISIINSSRWNFWQAGALRVWSGLVDTWDLLVANYLLLNCKFCLLPPVNLVSNVGNDTFSTHTLENTFPINFPISNSNLGPIDFSNIVRKPDRSANQFLEMEVFGIKKRHRFLGLYKKFTDRRLVRKYRNESLTDRLNSVLIP